MTTDRTMNDAHEWTTVRFAHIEISRLQEEQQQMIDRLIGIRINSKELNFVISHRHAITERIDKWFDLIAEVYGETLVDW